MFGNKDSALNRFVLPDKELSLKLVFDNVRNYAIVGLMFALSRWMQAEDARSSIRKFQESVPIDEKVVSLLVLVVAMILLLANLWQTNLLTMRSITVAIEWWMPQVARTDGLAKPRDYLIRTVAFIAVLLIYVALVSMVALIATYLSLFAGIGGKH